MIDGSLTEAVFPIQLLRTENDNSTKKCVVVSALHAAP
jgi:hypothetical protein